MILFVKSFCILWPLENPKYMESGKIEVGHNRACRVCCSTHNIHSVGQEVAVDIS